MTKEEAKQILLKTHSQAVQTVDNAKRDGYHALMFKYSTLDKIKKVLYEFVVYANESGLAVTIVKDDDVFKKDEGVSENTT